jgi:hypothetical protein
MALSPLMVWEVQTGGNDGNGGGFKDGASGTDYSLDAGSVAAGKHSGADLTMHATMNTKVLPVVAGVGADDVGNVVNITAGTGWTAGRYEITAQDGTYWTLDRSPCAAGSANLGTYVMGGALASPGMAGGAKVAGNDVWIKAGTYTIASTTANVSTGVVNDTTGGVDPTNISRWEGYQTTRGDKGTKPVLQVAASGVTSVTVCKMNAGHLTMDTLKVDGQGKSAITGFDMAVSYQRGLRLQAVGCTVYGFALSGGGVYSFYWKCSASGCSGTAGFQGGTSHTFVACESYDNTCHGFRAEGNSIYVRCLSYRNRGSGVNGFDCVSIGYRAIGCAAFYNQNDGFNLDGNAGYSTLIQDCLSVSNGGEGFGTDGVKGGAVIVNCAGYNNTGGNYSATNLKDVVGFVALSGDPFTSASTSTAGAADFSLNATAGAGASCRAAGMGTFPSGGTVGYPDIGAAQHADPAGGGAVDFPEPLRIGA